MEYVVASLLGLVTGITSFLPLSFSGHWALLSELFTVDQKVIKPLLSVAELGAALAALVYFRKDIIVSVQVMIRKLGRLPTNEKDLTSAVGLLGGSVVALVLCLSLKNISTFTGTGVVTGMLFLSAIIYMYAEWRYYQKPPQSALTSKQAVLISAVMAVALMPGLSMFGLAVSVGMLLGLARYEAARFTMLLSISVLLGLGSTGIFSSSMNGVAIDAALALTVLIVVFPITLLTISWGLRCMKNHTLWPFVWYNLVLATFVGYIAYFL